MQRAYQKQLSLIEQAINIEREVMVDHNNKRWEALYKQRDREEVAHMEYKFEQVCFTTLMSLPYCSCLEVKNS